MPIKFSQDESESVHVPKKMLFYLIDFPKLPKLERKSDLVEFYEKNSDYQILNSNVFYLFGSGVIYNDYSCFIEEVLSSL